MKIYHTETQADYDALMVELEAQGYVWATGRKPTESKDWTDRKENTCVKILDKRLTRGGISFFKAESPHVPIEKYKAKVNEMKFTKENIVGLFGDWYKNIIPSVGDLEKAIVDLEDTPEKVVVPKFVAEWIELCKDKANLVDCLQGSYHHCNGSEVIKEDEDWLFEGNNQEVVARAWIDGYEVEKEPLYHVIDKHEHFLLRRYDNGIDTMRISHTMKKEEHGHKSDFKLTEAEIKAIDERYWPFAVPAND